MAAKNVRFINRVSDGTTSYTVVTLATQRTVGRVINLRPGAWVARTASMTHLGEFVTRAEAGEALLDYYRGLS